MLYIHPHTQSILPAVKSKYLHRDEEEGHVIPCTSRACTEGLLTGMQALHDGGRVN